MRHLRPAPRRESAPEYQLSFEEPSSEINLAEYLNVLRRRWALLAAFLIVCIAGGLVHYFVTPSMYQASTRIQIDRRSFSLGGSLEAPWLENWWNMEYYPTQYKLLESRGMAERVVVDLRLYEDPVFNPGWAAWNRAEAEAGSRELDEAALGRLSRRLTGGLQVTPVKGTQLVDLTFRSMSPELSARVANGVADAFIEWGIQSRSATVGKATSFLGQQIENLKEEVLEKEALLRDYGRRSDVMAIDAQSSPTLQRLDAMNRDHIAAVSARISAEARYNEVVSTPRESIADTVSGGLVSQLRRELLRLEQEYATKLNVYKPDMPVMVDLRSKISEARAHMDAAVSEAVDQARRSAQAELSTARRREQALVTELDRAKEETLEMGSATVQYNNLLMEISTRRGLLNELLQRQSETEVAARLQDTRESNVRVVDRALVPGGAYSPSLRRDLGLALALGLALGAGCIFLLEYMDRTVKTAEESERLLGLPVLAVIPDISDRGRYGYGYQSYQYGTYGTYGANPRRRRLGALPWRDKRANGAEVAIELLPQQKPRHAVSEAYRSLRTALLLSSAEQLRIIALTSSQSGEGKTVTVANLGAVLAQLGRRVLVIDADLRKPRLHKVFRVTNRTGLVHALTAGGELADVIQPTGIPQLSIVPSGTIPPNPSELLASERMRELLDQAMRDFDVVLVDTPPVLAVTDASLVGAMADGVVFCLQAGRVLREEATASCERLHMAGVRVLGTVLNRYVAVKGVDPKHSYYYHYEASPEEQAAAKKSGGSAA